MYEKVGNWEKWKGELMAAMSVASMGTLKEGCWERGRENCWERWRDKLMVFLVLVREREKEERLGNLRAQLWEVVWREKKRQKREKESHDEMLVVVSLKALL